jgi:DMSO reductase iron-sulfur subunit
MRASFVFDANRCTGCQACQLACTIENGLDVDTSWRQIHTYNERRLPEIPLFHLSLACNHCAEPSCVDACPALAYSKDAITGAVLIDADKCIGCGYCSWACPYDAPRMDHARGVMTKCTFCNDRLHRGQRPACVELCPTDALGFEQLEERDITHSVPGFTQTDLRPSIRIVPLRPGRSRPEEAPLPDLPVQPPRDAGHRSHVGLAYEWPLAAFTFLSAALFALLTVSVFPFLVFQWRGEVVQPWAFVVRDRALGPFSFFVLAAATMFLGSAHLGQKMRGWRAVLGFRRSWLSREIVFFSAFVACGTWALAVRPGAVVPGVAALLLGLAALFSMDRVYRFARSTSPFPHSAGVLLTGLYFGALLLGPSRLLLVLAAAKLVSYVARKIELDGHGLPTRPVLSAARVLLTVVALWVLYSASRPSAAIVPGVAALAALAAELIDRGEFYEELEFPSPARQVAADLGRTGQKRSGSAHTA